jgi:nucleotide-binding universal stress UspA family protein
LPVWLVQGNLPTGKILLAVDGSEDALRAVDYISFMISENKELQLTLLHVTNTIHNYCEIDLDGDPDPELAKIIEKKDRICVDRFYPLAMEKFKGMGWANDQIKIETIQGGRNIGRLIIAYAVKNGFSTLVIGRRGINRSFFMGSVSRNIIKQISDTALWVVP